MAAIRSAQFVFGLADRKPLVGFPAGKIRVRLAPGDFAKAFVRSDIGLRAFYIKIDGDNWIPSHEIVRKIH